MPLVLLGRYTLLLVFPMHLSIDYGGWTIGWQVWPRDPYLYMGIVAAGAWCCAAVICWRKCNWAMLFCLLGLGLSYGIVGNIVALIGTIFADRLMYLPSAFFLLAAAIVLSRFPGRLVAPGVLIAAALAGMRTYTYERLWNDPVALFQQTIRLHPRSERRDTRCCGRFIRSASSGRRRWRSRKRRGKLRRGDGSPTRCAFNRSWGWRISPRRMQMRTKRSATFPGNSG